MNHTRIARFLIHPTPLLWMLFLAIVWTVTPTSSEAQDLAPVVTAPVTTSVCSNSPITFTVSAADPDGEAIASLTAPFLPTGATFTTNASNTSGTFNWTPNLGQTGIFSVTFTASNALIGSATTTITVLTGCRAPVVTAPTLVTFFENQAGQFTVSAADPDGESIATLTANPLPSGATFTSNVSHTSGTFSWTPTFTQSGTYAITFTAANDLTGSATTSITVAQFFDIPQVTAPASVSGVEGTSIVFTVTATTQVDAITAFSAAPLPPGATFTTNAAHTSGTFSWTPSFSQAGTYSVTFTASTSLSGSATTVITVANHSNSPVADAGGPYVGVANVALALDGSGSSDPEGDVLTYSWDFGDGTTGSGATPSHTYSTTGTYTVVLTVSDGTLSASDITTATIGDLSATVFTRSRYRRIRIGNNSGGKTWCVQVQPTNGAWSIEDIDVGSFRLSYGGYEITAVPSKERLASDVNGDGVLELQVCFALGDLATLGFPTGTSVATLAISGAFVSGGSFVGSLTIEIVNSAGGAAAASVSPNPLNPDATLTFETSRPGSLHVQLFDIGGRLIREIRDERFAGAGRHAVRIDGRDGRGARLATGVYFYRILSVDGIQQGRFTILK